MIEENSSDDDGGDDLNEYILFRWSVVKQARVSLTLAKQLFSGNAKYSNLNLVFSPFSIQIVLGLIASGSKSPIKNQIVRFLNEYSVEELNLLFSRLVNLIYAETQPSFANSVWIDDRLLNLLKPIVDNKARSNYVDFRNNAEEVRQGVNTWFMKQTNDLIEEILPSGSVSDSTRIIFANAVCFKGIWENKFDKSKTKRDEFFLLNGTSIQVPFMTSSDDQYIREFDEDIAFKILKLQYKKFHDKLQFSMYIYLPEAKDGLAALLEKMESERGFIGDTTPVARVRVGNFRIPSFKIDFGYEACEDLKRLGLELPRPFELSDDDVAANVSGIFHKSFIEVNEQGTLAEDEAEASTPATSNVRTGATIWPHSDKKLDFVADHPFLFAIREDLTSGAVLFIGQVLDPNQFAS